MVHQLHRRDSKTDCIVQELAISTGGSDHSAHGTYNSDLAAMPTEILQTIANYLPDRALCFLLATSRDIHHQLSSNKYFWRTRFHLAFDPAVFFEVDHENGQQILVTDPLRMKELDAKYDYRSQYQGRIRFLRHKHFVLDDMEYAVSILADHNNRNYPLLKTSTAIEEFLFRMPLSLAPSEKNLYMFNLIKSVLIPALGFPGISPRPLDPVYRIVYDSPRHPLFDPVNGVPQVHVIAALVTFWQMMNVQSGLGEFYKGMDALETLRQIYRPRRRTGQLKYNRATTLVIKDNELALLDAKDDDDDDGGGASTSMSPDITVTDNDDMPQMEDGSAVSGKRDDEESAWETETDGEPVSDDNRIFLGAYAFFNYWDFELFRSAPLSSETRRSIIGDIVDWHLDVPDEICGPISLRATGTSHQLTGITERRRSVVEITPIEEPIMGVRGWAVFNMRQLEFEVDRDIFEEQRWVHRAVMLPGSKAVVGRWHDGFDDDIERAVEGPVIWVLHIRRIRMLWFQYLETDH
ncbi:uncharacterized protein V1513DRAFT_384525 [Lipomyces chichibuensis]|uniref:uncharacterized protein n=1 Tax=Lipomyces chichibuensis TaxID=1546026 RepID=UPI0033439E88